MLRMSKLLTAGSIIFSLGFAACSPPEVPTPLELAGGDVLTSHADMMAFFNHLQEVTGAFSMETIGTSVQGRPIVSLRFSGPGEPADGEKLKVLVFAQQHGNEPSGKEAAMALARDIAMGDFDEFLEAVDFYLVPQVNPDGSEMEQRRNADDFDLNRDHLPLYTPEVQAIQSLYSSLLPHVSLDVHEYGFAGSSWVEAGLHKNFGHQIGALSNPNSPESLRRFAWDRVMPQLAVDLVPKDVELNRYLLTDGPDARVRYSTTALNDGRNGPAVYHTLSFLIEGENGITVESNIRERARKQLETIKAFLSFFAENADEVKAMVDHEREALANNDLPPQVALVMDYVPDPARPSVEYGVTVIETGQTETRVVEDFHPLVEATLWVDRPMGYVVPGGLTGVTAVLERHGIQFERVEAPRSATLEAYRIEGVEPTIKEDKDFLAVDVSVTREEGTIQAGDLVVWCDQMASTLIVTMLEPQSQWGLAPLPEFVSMLEPGTEFPIRRIVSVSDQ